eukprot:scaffold5772_cov105-Isochrysis_galbana.AAC.6
MGGRLGPLVRCSPSAGRVSRVCLSRGRSPFGTYPGCRGLLHPPGVAVLDQSVYNKTLLGILFFGARVRGIVSVAGEPPGQHGQGQPPASAHGPAAVHGRRALRSQCQVRRGRAHVQGVPHEALCQEPRLRSLPLLVLHGPSVPCEEGQRSDHLSQPGACVRNDCALQGPAQD